MSTGDVWTDTDSLFARRTFHPQDINDIVPCGPAPDACDGGRPTHRCRFHALAHGDIEIEDGQDIDAYEAK